jgi:hypothetical protein
MFASFRLCFTFTSSGPVRVTMNTALVSMESKEASSFAAASESSNAASRTESIYAVSPGGRKRNDTEYLLSRTSASDVAIDLELEVGAVAAATSTFVYATPQRFPQRKRGEEMPLTSEIQNNQDNEHVSAGIERFDESHLLGVASLADGSSSAANSPTGAATSN